MDYCGELKKESTIEPMVVIIVVSSLNKSSWSPFKFPYIMCNQDHQFVDCFHKYKVHVIIKGKTKPIVPNIVKMIYNVAINIVVVVTTIANWY